MMDVPSSTYFTAAPHWQWLIILYFFIGGLAGGTYFLAALIDVFGKPGDRPLARLGYYIAFPAVLLCAPLLILDLSRPLRFWHMLVERNTFGPMFKYWSPMSTGSWALAIFGFFAFLSFVTALAEDEHIRWPALARLRVSNIVCCAIAVLGGVFGFFLAGYTGVLLAVTNRPIWSDTPLLGLLFIVSAASTSAALMLLLAHRYGWTMPGLVKLHRMDTLMIGLELVVLAALLISLGPVLSAWLNAWGLLLLFGVILPGLVVPLAVSWRPGWIPGVTVATSAILVLVGGFLLRVVIVLSSETV
ncbi:MAG TPA: NrfD/PsrC family molybdoenzyme membrane anchor subunit [Vicinamibacterales bacterium]|nr:NrfD/PsrC family molybdoenzyme membrane anchor subunit [Vicinamibacterales bacterium]